MTGHRRRLESLEAAGALGSQAGSSDYWRAIHRTNVTGLASLRDYRLAFAPLAAENRDWLCAQIPLFAAMHRLGHPVSGVRTVAMYPPGEPLPEPLQQELRRLEDVVTATGTQVLEARESDGPLAADLSVSGRQQCAILYLAVGDAEGSPIRRLALERHGNLWQYSRYVHELAATKGLTRREYEAFREPLARYLPPADHLDVLGEVADRPSGATAGDKKSGWPWISFADMSELMDRQEPCPDGQIKSHPVTT